MRSHLNLPSREAAAATTPFSRNTSTRRAQIVLLPENECQLGVVPESSIVPEPCGPCIDTTRGRVPGRGRLTRYPATSSALCRITWATVDIGDKWVVVRGGGMVGGRKMGWWVEAERICSDQMCCGECSSVLGETPLAVSAMGMREPQALACPNRIPMHGICVHVMCNRMLICVSV